MARRRRGKCGEFGLQMRVLDGPEARALEPSIHPDVLGAVHFEEDAFLTPHLFVEGLAEAAAAHGAAILPQTELLGWAQENGRISAVQTTRAARCIRRRSLLAAGVWSAPLARRLGLKLPLQPAKGYSVTVQRPAAAPGKYLYLGEARVAVTPMGPGCAMPARWSWRALTSRSTSGAWTPSWAPSAAILPEWGKQKSSKSGAACAPVRPMACRISAVRARRPTC